MRPGYPKHAGEVLRDSFADKTGPEGLVDGRCIVSSRSISAHQVQKRVRSLNARKVPKASKCVASGEW
jgi:hypothetical protein